MNQKLKDNRVIGFEHQTLKGLEEYINDFLSDEFKPESKNYQLLDIKYSPPFAPGAYYTALMIISRNSKSG